MPVTLPVKVQRRLSPRGSNVERVLREQASGSSTFCSIQVQKHIGEVAGKIRNQETMPLKVCRNGSPRNLSILPPYTLLQEPLLDDGAV